MLFRTLVFALARPQYLYHIQADGQTDRHFVKIVKSCLGRTKARKSVKNGKPKIFKVHILTVFYRL